MRRNFGEENDRRDSLTSFKVALIMVLLTVIGLIVLALYADSGSTEIAKTEISEIAEDEDVRLDQVTEMIVVEDSGGQWVIAAFPVPEGGFDALLKEDEP